MLGRLVRWLNSWARWWKEAAGIKDEQYMSSEWVRHYRRLTHVERTRT